MRLAVIVFSEEHPFKTLQQFAEDGEKGIQEYIRRMTRGSGALARSIKASVYGKHVVVDSDLDYAQAVDQGTLSRRPMWELINRTIPLKLEGGQVIFRRVTIDSIRQGKWRQGPKEGIDFIRKGLELAKSEGAVQGRLDFQVRKPPKV